MKFRRFDRRAYVVRRPWTASERRVVWHGMMGRLAIAAEPFLGTIFFAFLTWGIIWRAHHSQAPDAGSIIVIAPIFALGALAFTVYAIAVMTAPIRAFLQTFAPIYIVDGYVRYRPPDEFSDVDSSGYVAVLFEDRDLACEWEAFGEQALPERTIPALSEFSTYGGIHKIDGVATGVLPERTTPFMIGLARRL